MCPKVLETKVRWVQMKGGQVILRKTFIFLNVYIDDKQPRMLPTSNKLQQHFSIKSPNTTKLSQSMASLAIAKGDKDKNTTKQRQLLML